MEYKITAKQCQEKIDKMQPVVCTGCGGQLTPLETVDNSGHPTYWVGCVSCQCFDNGTTLKNYKIAEKMVIERNLRPYSHMYEPIKKDDPEGYDYWQKSQIKGAVGIVKDVLSYYIILT